MHKSIQRFIQSGLERVQHSTEKSDDQIIY